MQNLVINSFYKEKELLEKNVKFKLFEELPADKISFYCIKDPFKANTFDTEEDAFNYLKQENPNYYEKYIIEYMGDVNGKLDVLKEKNIGKGGTRLISLNDSKSYYVYNVDNQRWEKFVGNMQRIIPLYEKLDQITDKELKKML